MTPKDPPDPGTSKRPLGKWQRRWSFRTTAVDTPLPETTATRPKVRDRYRWAVTIAVEKRKISLGASALANMLADKAGPRLGTVTSRTHRELGELIGRCPRQVANYLRELAHADLIEWHHAIDRTSEGHLRQRPNVYRCMISSEITSIMHDQVANSKKRTHRPEPPRQPWHKAASRPPVHSLDPIIVLDDRQVYEEIPDEFQGLSGIDLARAMFKRGAATQRRTKERPGTAAAPP